MSNEITAPHSNIAPYFQDARTEKLYEQFGNSPQARASIRNDRLSAAAADALWDLLISTSQDLIFHEAVSIGLLEGIQHVIRQIHTHGFLYAYSSLRQKESQTRFKKITHLDALFYSHKFPENPQARLLDQFGNPVDDTTARDYGFREGFIYALKLAYEVAQRGEGDFGSAKPSMLPPRRPRTSDLDLVGQGWERARELLAVCAGINPYENKIDDALLYYRYSETQSHRSRLIGKIRENRLYLGIFKNGFGKYSCKPNAYNQVFFDNTIKWCVARSDVMELVDMFTNAAKTTWEGATWINERHG